MDRGKSNNSSELSTRPGEVHKADVSVRNSPQTPQMSALHRFINKNGNRWRAYQRLWPILQMAFKFIYIAFPKETIRQS
jgi:hypothetical protein